MMSDSDLRQALLGTWRLISYQVDVDGTLVDAFGDNPQGYLVYTPDGHMLAQWGTRGERSWPPGPKVLESPQPLRDLGFGAYCGTFELRSGQVVHNREFGILPSMSGSIEPRSMKLDGDRLILGSSSRGAVVEWQRIH
jgi:hypothetical protein